MDVIYNISLGINRNSGFDNKYIGNYMNNLLIIING